MKTDLFALSNEKGGGGTARAGYSVSGTIKVSDSGGSPNGAVVTLIDSEGETITTQANANGDYSFFGIPEGDYTIQASLTGYTAFTTATFTVEDDVTVDAITLLRTFTGLKIAAALNAVKAAGSGAFLIELGDNESDVPNYDISGFTAPVTITIDGKGYTVNWASGTSTSAGCLTLSQADITLILKNVTFTGIISNRTQPLVWVKSGATFQIEAGTLLTGNLASNGGAVYVAIGGVFNMNGGAITGNKSSGYGHGVYVAGTMNITGGSITKNTHRTNTDGPNDVSVYAFSDSHGSLAMSADARIEHVYLYYYDSRSFGTITTDKAFSGDESVAILDLYDDASFDGKQILNGAAVPSSYKRFTPGVGRSNFSSGSGTPLTGSIDSDGVWRR